ncbi:hypothetical protein AB6A23_10035 [Paenibacillus tarimensis]
MANRKKRNYNKRNAARNRKPVHHDAEAAAEMAAAPVRTAVSPRDNAEDRSLRRTADTTQAAGRTVGWFALAFAIASWFIWGVLLGATSVVLGFIAYRQGSRSLGVWSITLGIIALLANLILTPLFATFV